MQFTKMQGCGNDYIYVNCFTETVSDPSRAAIRCQIAISASAATGSC